MALVGALGHMKDLIPSKLKEKQRSSGEVVEHKGKTWGTEPSGAVPGTVILSITASGLSLASNTNLWWRRLPSPNSASQELWGASCDLHGLTEQHTTAAALKGEGLCVLLSFSTWLPHACGAQAWQQPQPFPGWSCTMTSVPILCWQQAPFSCLRAAPALSSFVRMKGSSQSCTVCFDNRAALFALLYQYMEKWGLVLYLRY